MISLQDEISKFQKLVYNPQLAEFVTVDQMFVGGGITMESIINENNFIVEELKKLNSVFKNYCKLNDKVYSKITEHQLSVHSEQARLNALSNSIDRKLEDAIKKFKELYEDVVAQNQANKTVIVQSIEPLKKQLDDKVDFETFKAQMKKVLQQYEEGGQHEQEHGETVSRAGTDGGMGSDRAPNSPYPRKKGKLGFEQFYRFRDELDAKLKTSDEQIASVNFQSTQTKELLLKYIPQINVLADDNQENKKNFHRLGDSVNQVSNQMQKSIAKLVSQIDERLSQKVWNSKFDSFNEKTIKPIVLKLQESLKKITTTMKANKEEAVSQFKEVQASIMKNKNSIIVGSREREKLFSSIDTIQEKIEHNKIDIQTQIGERKNQIEKLSQETAKSVAYITNETREKIKDIKSQIETLSKTIEQSVMKGVSKRFEIQLKAIDKDIRTNSKNIKTLNQDIGLVEEQIKHIKSLLAQKANFTDIVHHVEKKANKEDIKELECKFHETSQHFYSKQLNQSINLSRLQKSESVSTKKNPKGTNNSRSLIGPQTAHNLDSGTKLFMCGMEGHIDGRKVFSQHSNRKRNIKTSNPIVSDFLL